MLFEIVTVISVAFATAGVVMLAFRLVRRRAPRTLVIALAAVAMLAYTAWNRHGWGERTIAALPDTIRVVERIPYSGWLEPWTLIEPRIGSLVAIDDSRTLRHPAHPGVAIVTLLHIEPYADTLALRQIVDCNGHRRAVLDSEPEFGDGDLPTDIRWIDGGQPAYLFAAVCERRLPGEAPVTATASK